MLTMWSRPEGPEEAALASRWCSRPDSTVVRVLAHVAKGLARYHAVALEGWENLPRGPALLVGNHGHLGYETLLFMAALYERTQRLAHGLADRWFFRVPLLRDVLVRAGGAYGHPANARRLLHEQQWVVCYPGGAREVLKRSDDDRYRLQWKSKRGFARLALQMRVPIVPFAAAGVDHTFCVAGSLAGTGRLLMGEDRYDLPRLASSRVVLPEPVPFLFRIGSPIHPLGGRGDTDKQVQRLHAEVWHRTQDLLDETVALWSSRRTGASHIVEQPCGH
jgi:1-acyl-sn-glycerol-3-phosphate acyltransferase